MNTLIFSILTSLFVSPAGDDQNAGTLNNPIRHIQSAIDRASFGDTINIMPGLYREHLYFERQTWPTNRIPGNIGKRIALRSYGTSPIIQASELVTVWTAITNKEEWTNVSSECFAPNTIFKTPWPEPPGIVMEEDDRPLRDVYTSVGPGTYIWRNQVLYIWPDRAPAAGIEIGTGQAIGGAPDYVELNGLRIRYSNTGYAGSMIQLGRFCWIENCEISWADFQGLSCWNSTVTNCTIYACGGKGLEAAWTNSVVSHCIIGGNNWRGFSQAGQAAGIKVITRYFDFPADVTGHRVEDCLFLTNNADAIWFDTVTGAATITRNSISNNAGGVFLECSGGIEVSQNQIIGNTNKGIVLRNSSSNLISGNVVMTLNGAPLDNAPMFMRADGDTVGYFNWSNRVLSNRFSTAIFQTVLFTGQDGPTAADYYYDNVYAWNTFTNEVSRTQLNVWPYPYSGGPSPYFTAAGFEAAVNGERSLFGNRPANPNTGNR